MTTTQISAWIMLVFCGLWSGGILIFAVERTDLWRRMPLEQYVQLANIMVKRVRKAEKILDKTRAALNAGEESPR